jgi:CubicO group peptidase (beta-lactamase class C family)
MRSKTATLVPAARTWGALAAFVYLLSFPAIADAQRNVQGTPEGTLRLVNKEVGDERWAITLHVETGIVTGHVYRADGGDPQYVWCSPQDAAADPLRLRCQGTRGCDEWVDLGEVTLAASFFRPAACEASAAPDIAFASAGRTGADTRSSGLRLTPDARHSLIAKDVGGLRWTMSYDHVEGTMTGNVFDPSGGAPQFVSCHYEGGLAPAQFTCLGASGCGCGGCQPSDWKPLPDVVVPGSFFRARRCPATPEPRGLVATLRPSRPEDAHDPDGPYGYGGFGESVAVSGNVAVAGSREKAVYVFENGADGWREVARIEPFEQAPGRPWTGRFATEVDVSGTRAVVMDNGKVRVLERGDGSWTRMSTIVPPEPNARVGSVAIEGSTIVLIVSSIDRSQPDRVHVYEPAGGGWSRSATIPLPGHASFEQFGGIDLAGERIAVLVQGGPSPSPQVFTQESLDVYEYRSGDWVLTASSELPHSPLALSYPAFALAGEDLVVGSAPESSLYRTRGVIRWLAQGPEDWSEVGSFSACSSDVGRFGELVAASGDTLVVGAPDGRTGGAAGDVHVFSRSAGSFAPQGRLRVGDTAFDTLALDGRTLLVGSTERAPGGGSVQVFDLDHVDLLPPVPCPEDPPETWPGDEWSVEPPTEHGMNPKVLAAAGEYALLPGSNTQGVVVARHGVIVAEWYEAGRDATSYGASWSVAKSIASALIGVAIERGDISDESVSMAEFYPDWAGTDKAAITLRHVLQMLSGLRWSEYYATTQDPLSDIGRMASQEKDQLSFAASKPAEVPPGTRWSYSSGDSMLFSGVIEAATGLSAGEYARRHLFGSLGMSRAQWWSDAVGHTLTYCCVDAPSREFARIGLLYARNGRWNDRQLLPERWVRDSAASAYSEQDGAQGYGYQWYSGSTGFPGSPLLEAYGFDGQSIYVIPELDLVVVRNGHYDKHPGPPIADPNLFALYPAAGLVPGLGTKPPDVSWAAGKLLDLIEDAVVAR